MPAYPSLCTSFPVVAATLSDVLLSTFHAQGPDQNLSRPANSCLLLKHASPAYYPPTNSPVSTHTDTRIRSLEPRDSLSGQDVTLPARAGPMVSQSQSRDGYHGASSGYHALRPARDSGVEQGGQVPELTGSSFRVACTSLLEQADRVLQDRGAPPPPHLRLAI